MVNVAVTWNRCLEQVCVYLSVSRKRVGRRKMTEDLEEDEKKKKKGKMEEDEERRL